MFKKAERKSAFLKVAVTGPSGSGKSLSSLLMAFGIGGKIAAIDTENGSLSLYADKGEFDVLEIHPPFTPDKYIAAIRGAEKAGYDVLLIDSLSHVWAGQGGVMDQKNDIDARGGNKYANWREPKSAHQKLKDELLQAQMHVICTMRSKQAYALSDGDNGKSQVKKLGMDPIAEPGLEYEFTTVLDIDMNHKAIASKDRTGMFNKVLFTPTQETGKQFVAWLGAAPVRQERSAVQGPENDEAGNIEDPGKFKITIGKKFLGKKIEDCDFDDLGKYLKWYKNDVEAGNQEKDRPPRALTHEEASNFVAFGRYEQMMIEAETALDSVGAK